jgi:hypothetical protein
MTKKGRQIGGFFDRWDYFGEPIPSFNIEGSSHVGSSIGFIFSIIMWITIFCYATLKGFHLLSKHNPQVSSAILYDKYDSDEVLKL